MLIWKKFSLFLPNMDSYPGLDSEIKGCLLYEFEKSCKRELDLPSSNLDLKTFWIALNCTIEFLAVDLIFKGFDKRTSLFRLILGELLYSIEFKLVMLSKNK
jgi:hypothetical protein